MRIVTTYKTNAKGTGQIVARLAGRQKTVNYDPRYSSDTNHGHAAAAVVHHVQASSPELQYGDNIVRALARSLDAGYGTHDSNDSGTVHVFEV